MMKIELWMDSFVENLRETFGNRVYFVGLQGSYARAEATEKSDIDTVVILDTLSAADIQTYGEMLDRMEHRELICGFLSGRDELLRWEPSDLFQFYYDTKPILGSLDQLLSLIDEAAVDRAINIAACNIYHGCVHNMLHEKEEEMLRGLYKAASFALQAICFKETGRYISRQAELIPCLTAENRAIAETFLTLKRGGEVRFREMSELLYNWAKKQITEV